MERKAPPPLLQSQQQAPLPLTKNGMPTRRLVPLPQAPRPGLPGPFPTTAGPGPTGTSAPATGTATGPPLTPGQVVALVRDARKKALADDDSRAPADADGIKPGITIDLIGKNIPALPDEVVDILRNGVERWVPVRSCHVLSATSDQSADPADRLALSHNSLASLPARFSLCTSLRYFAARNNGFEVLPLQASPSPLPASIHSTSDY